MFSPELTRASALQAVGSPVQHVRRRLTKHDPFVALDRALSQAIEMLGAADADVDEEVTGTLRGPWFRAWEKKGLEPLISTDDSLQSLFKEMMDNTLQHGTDWCEMGSICIDSYTNWFRGRALWIITQDGPGFDVQAAIAKLAEERENDRHGNGLRQAAKNPQWHVWFEQVRRPRARFRTLLLNAVNAGTTLKSA
jgi:hypothetical protein